MDNWQARMEYAARFIEKRLPGPWEMAVVTGTGLGQALSSLEGEAELLYRDIPHFPLSTVEGHEGRLVSGHAGGKGVLGLQGRVHYYEGYSLPEVTFPVRVLQALGIRKLVVTNAAGSLNTEFSPGQLVFIRDHINLIGDNPLVGPNHPELGPRFVDMHAAYSPAWLELAKAEAEGSGMTYQSGVYAGISGPTFQTPAELVFLQRIGVDLVGMSTVPEVIVANHAGMKVLGVSCVTDMALPESLGPISHRQVMQAAADGARLLQELLPRLLVRL